MKIIPTEMGLAVLPFNIVGDKSTDRGFCDGLIEILTSKLSQLERYHESIWIVPSSEVHEQGITSPSKARRTLGANLVIAESWQRTNGEVLLTLNLIETKKPRVIKSRHIKVQFGDIYTLQDKVVLEVTKMLDIKLHPQDLHVLTAGGTAVPEASELYLRGRGYLRRYENKEKVAEAISLFEQAIKKDSSYALAYAGLGEAYWYMWNLTKDPNCVQQAKSYCNHAIELSKKIAPPVLITLGIIYRDTGKYEEAVKEFQKVLQISQNNSDAHLELAWAYERLGRREEAEAAIKKAIDLKPDYWKGYSHLGALYYYHARYSETERMWRKVIELTPDNIRGYFNLGALYIKMGKTDLAIDMLKKSLEIKPYWLAASNLGTLYFFEGKYTEAMRMFEKAIDLGINNYVAWGNLADAYRYTPGYQEKAEKAYQKAIQLAEKELEINPKDTRVLSILARYHAVSGNNKEALAGISEARRLALDNMEVLHVSIKVYELINKRNKAIQAFEEYINLGGSIEEIRKDPDLYEFRKDPLYQELVKKKGLTESDSYS